MVKRKHLKPLKMLMLMLLMLFVLHSINGYMRSANHARAETECSEHGGLASYDLFDKYDRKLSFNNEMENNFTLNEGDSAWIKGYAEFSLFLSWHGCFIKNQNPNAALPEQDIQDNNLHVCSNYCCGNHNCSTFIGLRGRVCICMTNAYLEEMNPCPDIQCKIQSQNLRYSSNKTLLTNEAIDVYKIHDPKTILWDEGQSDKQQCVYAQVKGNNSMKVAYYKTKSCFTFTIYGFICVKSPNRTLSVSCNEKNVTSSVCFAQQMYSWLDARDQCCNFNGNMIGIINKDERKHANTYRKYWTGIFRSFKIHDNQDDHDFACLAATRINNTLVLDPDDCSRYKRFLCRNNMTQVNVTTASYHVTSTETRTTSESTVTSQVNKRENNETSEGVSGIYIYIGIGAAIFFVAMLIIVLVYKVRKHKVKAQHRTGPKENEHNVVYAEPYNDIKPDTNTDRIYVSDQNYEYADQCGRTHLNKSTTGSEYDRVHLKIQNDSCNIESMDGNVYDHTERVSDPDQYNILGNFSHTRQQNVCDETYSKLGIGDSNYGTLFQCKAKASTSTTKDQVSEIDNDTYAHTSQFK